MPHVYVLNISAELASAAENKASFHRLQPERCLPGGSVGHAIGSRKPLSPAVRIIFRQVGERGAAPQGPALLQICEGDYMIRLLCISVYMTLFYVL